MFIPLLIRDHYGDALKIIQKLDHGEGLTKYGKEVKALAQDIWESTNIKDKSRKCAS